ncbi:hypothetical protein [Kineosporia sp. NBRC 101731]|uniref:hypothetical protein n=1 Tax=Kineosporia sp. NBRC 101731 TaxID=3032199 RepID=UPI0024A5AB9E|nr:hypothetical protein [Kineosporia sp. NBRC 101731]GLY30674.1 hypothetical protein Kisp02_40390 [Kineosporia sp. NBRC 101731]
MSQNGLEERLSALLGGNELDLLARDGATSTVMDGVRRARRRRRAMQVAVPTVLVVGTIAAGATFLPRYHEQAAPTLPSSKVLSGNGIGGLTLGMSITDARDAGLIGRETTVPGGRAASCATYDGHGSIEQILAQDDTVAAITVDAFAETPAGINIGDTYGDLRKAYPDAPDENAGTGTTVLQVPNMGGAGSRAKSGSGAGAESGAGSQYEFTFEATGGESAAGSGADPLPSSTRITALALSSGDSGLQTCRL